MGLSHSRTMAAVSSGAASLFCEGPLLHAVQAMGVFKDSKTFVDMPAKADPEHILKAFSQLAEDDKTSVQALTAFVATHFDDVGADLLPHSPADFVVDLPFITTIRQPDMARWAAALHALWPGLTRQVSPDVKANPQRHSLLHRANAVVVPGGRFRESYYWDSYWICKGLLVSGMAQTAQGVVQNLLDDVKTFGHVPNGGRLYYTQRTQPPLLSDMVLDLVTAATAEGANRGQHENGLAFLQEALPVLEQEYRFWMQQRSVTIAGHVLNRYWCAAAAARPRPESYREDLATSSGDRVVLAELTAAAESGWDFSSRWWLKGNSSDGTGDGGGGGGDAAGAHSGQLRDTQITRMVPVDHNAFLYRYETNLAHFCALLGRPDDGTTYRTAAEARAAAMLNLMWDETASLWRDLVLPPAADDASTRTTAYVGCTQSEHVTAACFVPLWAGEVFRREATVAALLSSGLLDGGGGVMMTSLVASGQQWDMPNSWPPLQWLIVEGLRATVGGKELADKLALEWLRSAHQAWAETGFMHEKLDGQRTGGVGKGGEYEPQVGFGWTNGVALDWLKRYFGDSAASPSLESSVKEACAGC
eukprot:TRINITY_DN4729_c0_g1_i2.p1 TRINITY_DN4729_c0_g1~~TRINITY_DN4729_c0_g1_i2.p1  ORF type:complete len:589 (-),score=111.45 TRINITY_DN4729_c0_g1_i2:110-1876(-)